MSDELHIAGLVVHAYPESVQRVVATLVAMPGAEVHAASRDGKLVVTLEADKRATTIADAHGRIQTHSTACCPPSLVYQHNESARSDDRRGRT